MCSKGGCDGVSEFGGDWSDGRGQWDPQVICIFVFVFVFLHICLSFIHFHQGSNERSVKPRVAQVNGLPRKLT